MLAQLVRAQPRMQKVLGSNPTQGSSFFFEDDCLGICIVLLFHCLSCGLISCIVHMYFWCTGAVKAIDNSFFFSLFLSLCSVGLYACSFSCTGTV